MSDAEAKKEPAVYGPDGKRIERDGYYLLKPEPERRLPNYRIAWFDNVARQRRTVSTRKSDVGDAVAALIAYAQEHPRTCGESTVEETHTVRTMLHEGQTAVQPILDWLAQVAQDATGPLPQRLKRAYDLPLKIVMATYYAARLAAARAQKRSKRKHRFIKKAAEGLVYALKDAVEVWGEDVTVRMLDGPLQHRFIANRRAQLQENGERRFTDTTIATRLQYIWSAIHYCIKVAGILQEDAVHERVPTNQWQPKAQLGRRKLRGFDIEAMALFVRAAFRKERWLRATLLGLLGSRPMAVLDLQPGNLDMKHGTLDLLEIYDDGSVALQNGIKNRATIKIPPTMFRWFTFWNAQPVPRGHAPQYVNYYGKAMTTFQWVHEIANHAGIRLPKGMGAYLFRHFLATYLVNNGCPIDQVKVLLGHDILEGSIRFYPELQPQFLARVSELIEQLFHALDELLPEDLTILVPHAAQELPDNGFAAVDERDPMPTWQPDPVKLSFDWESFCQRAVNVPDPLPKPAQRERCASVAQEGISLQGNKGLSSITDTCGTTPKRP